MTKLDIDQIRQVIREEISKSTVDEMMDSNTVAEKLGLTTGTLATYRCIGRGPKYVRTGKRIMYRAADVAEYINSRVVKP